MKYCTVDKIKVANKVKCVAQDKAFGIEDCSVLEALLKKGKTYKDCRFLKEYKKIIPPEKLNKKLLSLLKQLQNWKIEDKEDGIQLQLFIQQELKKVKIEL